MNKITYLSQGGYDNLKAELDDLKGRGRQDAAKAIGEAREKGDLSENAEYDAAKDAQGMLEARINELDKAFAGARVLDASQLDTSNVTILSTVTIKNTKNNREMSYQLVSAAEADMKAKKISISSPIGEGLLGKAVGDSVEITTPAGVMTFEVMDIKIV